MSMPVNGAFTHHRKRSRTSGDDSSEPSNSDESALVATSAAGPSTDASDYESDSESELSESSEEPSDESSSEEHDDDGDTEMEEQEGQEGVVNLRADRGTKPIMRLEQDEMGPDIRTFLKDFLPRLAAANDELEAQKKAGTLQSLEADGEQEEGAPYIEMDLGLGVLEAKDPNAASHSDSETDQSDTEGTVTETDRLGKLMGRGKKGSAGIEVLQNTSTT